MPCSVLQWLKQRTRLCRTFLRNLVWWRSCYSKGFLPCSEGRTSASCLTICSPAAAVQNLQLHRSSTNLPDEPVQQLMIHSWSSEKDREAATRGLQQCISLLFLCSRFDLARLSQSHRGRALPGEGSIKARDASHRLLPRCLCHLQAGPYEVVIYIQRESYRLMPRICAPTFEGICCAKTKKNKIPSAWSIWQLHIQHFKEGEQRATSLPQPPRGRSPGK